MAWFQDLTACSYFGEQYTPMLRAVGWLERDHSFETGDVNPEIFSKLIELRKAPWAPLASAGYHACTICTFEGEARGNANLFIPGQHDIFVCPELIIHYMNAHQYCPPAEFCEAVKTCPAMKSREYFKAILAVGGRPLIKET